MLLILLSQLFGKWLIHADDYFDHDYTSLSLIFVQGSDSGGIAVADIQCIVIHNSHLPLILIGLRLLCYVFRHHQNNKSRLNIKVFNHQLAT